MSNATSASRTILLGSTVALLLAPFACGCQPPWASGFLLAFVTLAAVAYIAFQIAAGQPWLRGYRAPFLAAAITVCWLGLTVLFDLARGPEHGRVPSLSVNQLSYAVAFLAAACLGAASCQGFARLKAFLRLLVLVGALLAGLALAEAAGWDAKRLLQYDAPASGRPSGIYTNANRFAVLLSVCWLGGLGVFAAEILGPHGPDCTPFRQRLRQGSLLLGLVVIGGSIGLTLSRLTMLATALSLGVVLGACVALWRRAQEKRRTSFDALSPVEKAKAYGFLALPMVAMGCWFVWNLTIGADALRFRLAAAMTEQDPSIGQRWLVITSSLPLLWSNPVMGHGLGTFNALFPSVQPPGVHGWWREAQSDWLQLAVEAGLPAVLLAGAALVVWGRACWSRIARLADNDPRLVPKQAHSDRERDCAEVTPTDPT
jgi:hypothetical protein